jgi:uncharacterized protein YjiS (DUF1127 family)
MFASLHTSSLAVSGLETPKGLDAVLHRVRLALAAHAQRRALARLDAHLLRDLGLDAERVAAECARPAWDVPSHWLSRR